MPREFIISADASWVSGSISGNAVIKPFIQSTATVASLKNTGVPYKLTLGDTNTAETAPNTDNSYT